MPHAERYLYYRQRRRPGPRLLGVLPPPEGWAADFRILRMMRESSDIVGQLVSETPDRTAKAFAAKHPVPEDLLDAVESLSEVRAVELILPDDPRATGR